MQDERTRREWKLSYAAIEIPGTAPISAPSVSELPRPTRADFQVGDRVSFDARHLHTRFGLRLHRQPPTTP